MGANQASRASATKGSVDMPTATKTLDFQIVEDRNDSSSWRVEAIDYDNEGVIYQALFMGPGAHERAGEYAAWKNGKR